MVCGEKSVPFAYFSFFKGGISENSDKIKIGKGVFATNKQNKCSNSYIFATLWCKPLIFQTYIIRSNIIHSLKYQRFTTFGCKDIEIRKSEFATKSYFFRPAINVPKVMRVITKNCVRSV